jgi:hypothetical protein
MFYLVSIHLREKKSVVQAESTEIAVVPYLSPVDTSSFQLDISLVNEMVARRQEETRALIINQLDLSTTVQEALQTSVLDRK